MRWIGSCGKHGLSYLIREEVGGHGDNAGFMEN